jgi:hypothetical protein
MYYKYFIDLIILPTSFYSSRIFMYYMDYETVYPCIPLLLILTLNFP